MDGIHVEKKLKKIISNIFGISEDKITDDTSTENVEKWDSLNHINLILSIEEQFGITISEDEMIEMTSFVNIKKILSVKGIKN